MKARAASRAAEETVAVEVVVGRSRRSRRTLHRRHPAALLARLGLAGVKPPLVALPEPARGLVRAAEPEQVPARVLVRRLVRLLRR